MPGTWPDEQYGQASESVALACLELLTDESRWIHRRVETIDLLAQELVRRQVSVDFTLPEPLIDDLRIGGADSPWCVPIAILEKRPLRHFDLREHDEWRPILGASSGGPIAAGLVTAAARLAIAPEALEPEVASLLALIARSDLEQARTAMIELRNRAAHAPQIARILDDATSGYFLATFAESYILIALLAQPGGRRILKYAYDEHLRFGDEASRARRLARRLGWSPFVVDVAVPTAAHAASYHAEVVVPEELRLDAWILDERADVLLSTDIERSVDRASLHAPRVALDAQPLLVAAISPERADLPTLAFATSAVTTLLLALGATVADLGSPTAVSSVALLLAGSVLFTTAVARSGEHRLVRAIFAGPRWLLSIVAVAALAAAASVAFGADDRVRDVVWYSGAAISGLACLSLAVGCYRAASLTRRQHRAGADEEL